MVVSTSNDRLLATLICLLGCSGAALSLRTRLTSESPVAEPCGLDLAFVLRCGGLLGCAEMPAGSELRKCNTNSIVLVVFQNRHERLLAAVGINRRFVHVGFLHPPLVNE